MTLPPPENLHARLPKARITLRDNANGETRTFVEDWTGEVSAGWGWTPDLSNVWYVWTEGNSSCDCNRALHFGFPIDHDRPCGDEKAYSMIAFEPIDA